MPQFNTGDEISSTYSNTIDLWSTTEVDEALNSYYDYPRSALGHIAYNLAADVLAGTDQHRALYETLVLEDRLQLIDHFAVSHELLMISSRHDQRRLHDHIYDFHAALPFSEQERARLLSFARFSAWRNPSSTEPPQTLARNLRLLMPAAINLSQGQPHSSSGPGLLRRWDAWHNQVDEFAGTGSLRQSRRAAVEIARMCFQAAYVRTPSDADLEQLLSNIDRTDS